MPYDYLENLASRGWVVENREEEIIILEEVIGRRAVLAYMPIYTHVTGRGPIVPDECNLYSPKTKPRSGAGYQVLRFVYDHLGENLIFEVVPNTENGTAQVRAVTKKIDGEHKSQWLRFAKKFA